MNMSFPYNCYFTTFCSSTPFTPFLHEHPRNEITDEGNVLKYITKFQISPIESLLDDFVLCLTEFLLLRLLKRFWTRLIFYP